MTSKEGSKLNMFRTAIQLCDNNAVIIAANPAFLRSLNALKANNNSLTATLTAESQVISGITEDKTVAKNNLVQQATDVAGIVYAYAAGSNNNTLAKQVDYSASDFRKIKDEKLAPTLQNIHDIANANVAALADFGVTPAMLTAFQTAISDYSSSVPGPRTARSVKSTYTSNIKQLLKEGDNILKTQMDKLLVTFKATNPDFVTSYKNAQKIIDASSTGTQLKVTVTDSAGKGPLKNIRVEVIGVTTAAATTTATGIAIFRPLNNGNYVVNANAPGYKTSTAEIEVKQGKINKASLVLIAA